MYEKFYQLSPTIILITDNLTKNFDDFIPHHKQQLLIDARQIDFSNNCSLSLSSSIPGSYRAFGNLSNWEIENGTQRIGVAIEQDSPLDLIKFIYDLNCFSRGILLLNEYSYNNQQITLFRNCLFPLISTTIIFSFCLLLSMIEHKYDTYNNSLIFRQASSITASTSITILAFLFLIRPILELVDFMHLIIIRKEKHCGKNISCVLFQNFLSF